MMAKAKAAAAKGPVRYNSPFDFMLTSTNLSSIGPPWSQITAYDLNTGDIKWQVPLGTVDAPASVGIPADSGSHWPRGGPLVTAGGLRVRGHQLRHDVPRVRSRHREGGVEHEAAGGVGGGAGDV